jgi:hypothetical protein
VPQSVFNVNGDFLQKKFTFARMNSANVQMEEVSQKWQLAFSRYRSPIGMIERKGHEKLKYE